ncbi:MAG TPA: hypothetical protein VFW44_07955, partial [Bryobacteraceae bacterium]|nr:hypothetical protein [Bryobacteraceae bacterium]
MKLPLFAIALATTVSLAAQEPPHPRAGSSCTQSRLVIVITSIFDGEFLAANTPQRLSVLVDDDCGNPVTQARVQAMFSDGEPTINLIATGNGRYEGTFTLRPSIAGQTLIRVLAVGPQFGTLIATATTAVQVLGLTLSQTGFTFQAVAGGPAPAPAELNLRLGSSAGLKVTAATAAGQSPSWLTLQTQVNSSMSATVTLQADARGLPLGDYYARLRVDSPDDPSSPQFATIVLDVVATESAASATPRERLPAKPRQGPCSPTSLTPSIAIAAGGYEPAVSWPTPLIVTVLDDCQQPMPSGGVTSVSFSNGDPQMELVAQGSGIWTGTWTPQAAGKSVDITATATYAGSNPNLSGTSTLSFGLQSDAGAPLFVSGGVVSAASYQSASQFAPGDMIAIFGGQLANGSAAADILPLPIQLQDTLALIGPLPVSLLYANGKQVNGILPYGLHPNQEYQLVVSNSSRISTPQTIRIVPSNIAIFSANATGSGQALVFHANSSDLVDEKHPAK